MPVERYRNPRKARWPQADYIIGSGFIVTPEGVIHLGLGNIQGVERHIRNYRHGRDLTDKPRGVKVIDLFGLTSEDVRHRYPAIYQWVLERVKPERDQNNRAGCRDKRWIFGEARSEWRRMCATLPRYIAAGIQSGAAASRWLTA